MSAASPFGLRLGTTLFSFTNPFHARQYSFEQLIAKVAELNVGPGVELVGFQSIRGFPAVSDAFAERFRELMYQSKLTPSALSINADAAIRRAAANAGESAAYLEPKIRAAAKLGFRVVRSQFAAPAEAVERLVPLVEEAIRIGPEDYAPLSVNSAAGNGLSGNVRPGQFAESWIHSGFWRFARTLPASYLKCYEALACLNNCWLWPWRYGRSGRFRGQTR
jgi:hypothetical protein